MDLFIFNNDLQRLEINEYSILLIKEFAALWNEDSNISKEDPKGIKRLRAYREFAYIYLALDYKSPYFEYLEQEKHQAAMEDSGLTEKEINDETFIPAYRKYIELKDSSRILSLIKTAFRTLEKMRVFLDSIDFNERDELNGGKYINDPKKIMESLTQIGKMDAYLKELELTYKKGLKAQSKLRADNEPGFGDMDQLQR